MFRYVNTFLSKVLSKVYPFFSLTFDSESELFENIYKELTNTFYPKAILERMYDNSKKIDANMGVFLTSRCPPFIVSVDETYHKFKILSDVSNKGYETKKVNELVLFGPGSSEKDFVQELYSRIRDSDSSLIYLDVIPELHTSRTINLIKEAILKNKKLRILAYTCFDYEEGNYIEGAIFYKRGRDSKISIYLLGN